jgi:demethylmenaquinone methyltransferase/2-methoxy-6-polyprenyl-1,4-benzoquinol methylase
MSEQRTTWLAGDMETSYGFRNVAPGEKQGLVNEVFTSVAKRYDIMNDLMSGGLHRLCGRRRWFPGSTRRRARRLAQLLDVAGGTGDVAFRMVERRRPATRGDRARHQRRRC